jgi:SAM-dependent methyltransferase
MHPSSLSNMRKLYSKYIAGEFRDSRAQINTVDVGSCCIGELSKSSYRSIFSDPKFSYLGIDIAPGPGVDLVLKNPYEIPLQDAYADLVISGQMFEHCEFFWLTFKEMVRILKRDGLLFLIAPSMGGIHRYPVDCYRFYPDGYRALAKWADCDCVEVWLDRESSWGDLVGTFRHRPNGVVQSSNAPENRAAQAHPRWRTTDRSSADQPRKIHPLSL